MHNAMVLSIFLSCSSEKKKDSNIVSQACYSPSFFRPWSLSRSCTYQNKDPTWSQHTRVLMKKNNKINPLTFPNLQRKNISKLIIQIHSPNQGPCFVQARYKNQNSCTHAYMLAYKWSKVLDPNAIEVSIVVVAKSCPTLCNPHELQHTRFLCPLLSAGVCLNSYPLSQWYHPTISSSVLSPSSSLAFNLSQHQGLFQWVSSLHQMATVLPVPIKKLYAYSERFSGKVQV